MALASWHCAVTHTHSDPLQQWSEKFTCILQCIQMFNHALIMVSSYWQGGQRLGSEQCLFRFSAFLPRVEHVCAELRLHLHMALMLILPCHQFLGRVFYPQIRQKLIALDLCKSVQKLHDLSTKDVSDKSIKTQSTMTYNCKRLLSHWSCLEQACTRISWLVVQLFVCHHAKKRPNTQENGCWITPSDHIHGLVHS